MFKPEDPDFFCRIKQQEVDAGTPIGKFDPASDPNDLKLLFAQLVAKARIELIR